MNETQLLHLESYIWLKDQQGDTPSCCLIWGKVSFIISHPGKRFRFPYKKTVSEFPCRWVQEPKRHWWKRSEEEIQGGCLPDITWTPAQPSPEPRDPVVDWISGYLYDAKKREWTLNSIRQCSVIPAKLWNRSPIMRGTSASSKVQRMSKHLPN